jgi:glutaminase
MAHVAERTHVSTGRLPSPVRVRNLVGEAHVLFGANREGTVSDVYPALKRVPPDLFGIAVAAVSGATHATGDADHPFAIMSVSKPFVFALVCEAVGPAEARARLGANATGLPFNSVEAVERAAGGTTNPMVNHGAIATTSLAPGATPELKWEWIHEGLSRFAGRELQLDDDVYRSACRTNHRTRALAYLLESYERLYCEPAVAAELYTRQCSLSVTAIDLAVMGATLADGGVNPLTGQRVVDAEVCHHALAVMTTAGLYETSGDWLYEVGLPGKSGIGGGIVTVSPGKGGLATFAPRLDPAGNSVKGQLAARFLARRLGLGLFLSAPSGQ